MTEELAQQLRDAGYPQGSVRIRYEIWNDETNQYDLEPVRPEEPTLEELIEACGSKFDMLKNNGRSWRAYGDAPKIEMGEGITPSEAVAELWLALSEKKRNQAKLS